VLPFDHDVESPVGTRNDLDCLTQSPMVLPDHSPDFEDSLKRTITSGFNPLPQTSYQPKKTDGILQNSTEECDDFWDCPFISPKGSVTHCCGPKPNRRLILPI
jgi:hypothetical protein